MSELQALFEQMEGRFNADASAGLDAVFQYDIEDHGSWQMSVADEKCQLSSGDSNEATVTLAMEADTLKGVMSGEVDGMQAFMTGSIKATGDIMLATRLTDLFPVT